ncbi:D-alanyl-D-alanine carboxypeptidase family protein, partial [Patescibacteria group bacterium]
MVTFKNIQKRFSSLKPVKKGKKKKSGINYTSLAGDNMLFLAMLSFVFISTTAFVMTGKTKKSEVKGIKTIIWERESKVYPSIPTLQRNYQSFPVVSAQAALVIDLSSGTALYEKNPDMGLLPASTTKIVTALVAMDYYKDSDVLVVDGTKVDGRKMGLYSGEEITAGSLLKGLLIYSANDAAEVLAENYEGGRGAFISAMNMKAKDLTLNNTY